MIDDEPAIACNLNALSRDEQMRRAELAARLSSAFQEIREITDGYAARLDFEPSVCAQALEWLLLERRCCPFLRLEVRLDAQDGPLWLHFGGAPGVKQFLAAAGIATRAPQSTSRCGC